MTFRWITDWDEIWSEEFVSQWNEWLEKSENSHVFFHPAMVKAWVDTYDKIHNIKPMFCITKVEDNVVFFPLVLWQKNWKNASLKTIVPVGYSVFDYLTPLYVEGSKKIDWKVYWSELVESTEKYFSDAYDVIEFPSVLKEYTISGWEFEDVCPYSNVSEFSAKDEFVKSRKASFRHTIKRRMRRLDELGAVEFKVVESVEEALCYLPELLTLHICLWPNAYKAPSFHENIIRNALPSGVLHFSIVLLNKEPISYVLSFVNDGRYYHYMSAYNLSYRNLSIGNLHILYLFEDCIQKGFHTYDLLRGDENYKFDWTTDSEEVYKFRKVNNKFLTKAKLLLVSLKEKIKR